MHCGQDWSQLRRRFCTECAMNFPIDKSGPDSWDGQSARLFVVAGRVRSPWCDQPMLDIKLVKNSRHDEIDQSFE